MNMNRLKRIWSMLLCLALLLGNFPAMVFAEGEEVPATEPVAAVEETTAPTAAPTEPPAVEDATEAPTEAPQPEETAAPTAAPTEVPAEEAIASTEPPAPEETTLPTEDLGSEEGIITDEAMLAYSGFCGDNLRYSFTGSSGTLTISGTGNMEDFIYYDSVQPWKDYRSSIKSVVIESGVTSIGAAAFERCSSLSSIAIPDTVTSIGMHAFQNCSSLSSIAIPDGVQIIDYKTFYNCSSLTSIILPDNLQSIGEYAFYDCSGLTSITIPSSVTSIGLSAFEDCSGLTSIILPDNLQSIGEYAFYDCSGLTSITIPSSVTSIGLSAFEDCSGLTSIILPDNLQSIGSYAFDGCSGLTSITIPSSVTSIGTDAFIRCSYSLDIYITDPSAWCNIKFGEGEAPDKRLHILDENGNEVTEVMLDDSVTVIPAYAFRMSSLTSITIPGTVTSIGSAAFLGCTNLTSIVIPDSVQSIGDYAFSNCASLAGIVIPNSVQNIGMLAFGNCTGLTSVTMGSGVTTIGKEAFYRCESLTDVYITDANAWCKISGISNLASPADCLHILDEAGNEVTELVLDDSVTVIPAYAFSKSSLTSITIPDTVTSIGAGAFSHCTSLTSITIPDTVTSIGESAFSYCSSLPSIAIPDSVTSIGNSAFFRCTSLTSIAIPDSVTSIGTYAFYYCRSLTSIAIPDSVTSIGNYAFSDCTSLTSIVIPNSVQSISDYAFYYCTNLTGITIPDSVQSMGSHTFDHCHNLTDITIGSGVQSISDYAFYSCRSLPSIVIPDSVQSIGNHAFSDCTSLASIVVPDSVQSIGTDAFYYCTNLTDVYITDANAWCKISGISNLAGHADCLHILDEAGNKVTALVLDDSVTVIPEYAFKGSNLTSITIPDSVQSMGSHAFDDCRNLTDITIGSGVQNISDYAFYSCSSLTSIVIPDTVTSIGNYAFCGCSSLTSITIPNSVTTIGAGTFSGCSSLTSITIPNSVTSIGNYAFRGCSSLTSITIPNSVQSIGTYAFYNCDRLTDIILGYGIQSIGDYAFVGCSRLFHIFYTGTETQWANISVGSSNSCLTNAKCHTGTSSSTLVKYEHTTCTTKSLYKCTICNDVCYDKTYTGTHQYVDGVCAVCNTSNTVQYSVAKDTVTITGYARSAKAVVIPSEIEGFPVTAIGDSAFSGRTDLTAITIPDSVQNIGNYAFDGCTGLTNITIPDSLSQLGTFAFRSCTALKTIALPDQLQSIPLGAFEAAGLEEIVIGKNVGIIFSGAFLNCTSLHSVSFPASAEVGRYAFDGCKKIKNITVTPGSGDMFDYTEESCMGLPWHQNTSEIISITLEDGIRSIGDYALSGMQNVRSIVVPGSVRSIGSYAFSGSRFFAVQLPEGITSIPEGTFSFCIKMRTVNIPKSIRSIGANAFRGCIALKGIDLPEGLTELGTAAFMGSALESITLPASLGTLGVYAFSQCPQLKTAILSQNLRTIGDSAFSGCDNLEDLFIRSTNLYIEEYAFFSCDKLIIYFSGSKNQWNVSQPGSGVYIENTYGTNNILSSRWNSNDYLIFAPVRYNSIASTVQKVNILDAEGITGTKNAVLNGQVIKVDMNQFDYFDVHCTQEPADAVNQEIAWFCASTEFEGAAALSPINGTNIATVIPLYPCDFVVSATNTYSGASASVHFVFWRPVHSISITGDYNGIVALDTPVKLQAEILPASADNQKVRWQVENLTGEAFILDGGIFMGTKPGQVIVRAEATDGSGVITTKTIEIMEYTVQASGVDTLPSKKSATLSAELVPFNMTDTTILWELENPADSQYITLNGNQLTALPVSEAHDVVLVARAADGVAQPARITVRVLPLATSVDILRGEETVSKQTIVYDISKPEQVEIVLTGITCPDDAGDEIKWTISDTKEKYARYIVDGNRITLRDPKGPLGTVTITASTKDGSNKSTSVTLKSIYLDPASKLTAEAEVPAIGLQTTYETTMLVYGANKEAALDPANLTFTTSDEEIATVDESGVITAGSEAGTATITAAITGDPLNRKISVKVKVIALQTAELTLIPIADVFEGAVMLDAEGNVTENAEEAAEVYLDKAVLKDGNILHIEALAKAIDFDGNETITNPTLTWTSTDTAIATVTAKNGSAEVVLKTDGAVTVTAVTKDLSKAEKSLVIHVCDYAPRLAATSLTLNTNLIPDAAYGVRTALVESYGKAIVDVALYENGSDEPSETLIPSYENGELVITHQEQLKNGTLKLKLAVTVEGKEEPYYYNISLKIANTLPSVTVKQASKLNLFYTDSEAQLNVTAKDAIIEHVELADTDSFVLDQNEGGAWTIYNQHTGTGKPDTAANLLVYVEGYDVPIEKKFTVGTTTTKPALAMTATSSVINTAIVGMDHTAAFGVYDKKTKETLMLNDGDVYVEEDSFVNCTALADGTVELSLKESKSGSAKVYVQLDNWAQPITLTHKITVKKDLPTAKLSTSTLKLNKLLPGVAAEATVTLNQGNLEVGDIAFTATGKNAAEAEKITVEYNSASGCIEASLDPADLPAKGTYSFDYVITLDDAATTLAKKTLKVTVSETKPTVKVGTIKLNNWFGSGGVTEAAVTMTKGDGYRLIDMEVPKNWKADKFDISYNEETGMLIVEMRAEDVKAGKQTVELTPVLVHEGSGHEVRLTPVKATVQIASGKPSVSVSTKGKLDAIVSDSAITYTVSKVNNLPGSIVDVTLKGTDAELFEAELDTTGSKPVVTLTRAAGSEIATNKTYKLELVFTAQWENNGSVVTYEQAVSINVKPTQSALKFAKIPTLNLYQSSDLPMTCTVVLTSPVGAELDESSFVLSSKSAAQFKKAFGDGYLDYNAETGELTIAVENPAALSNGKSYTVYLDVAPVNSATNVKPTQLKLTVKAFK